MEAAASFPTPKVPIPIVNATAGLNTSTVATTTLAPTTASENEGEGGESTTTEEPVAATGAGVRVSCVSGWKGMVGVVILLWVGGIV